MNLVNIDLVLPAAYNPRKTDGKRLQLLKSSLTKLGWVLPLYATKQGDQFELVSGHQRTLAAKELGYKKVPLVVLPEMDLGHRKILNILFNRGTNDFRIDDNSSNIHEKIEQERFQALLESMPDRKDFYPCFETKKVPLSKLWDKNKQNTTPYSETITRNMAKYDVHMPIVCDKDLNIVNGIGRLSHYLARKEQDCDCVFLGETEAEFAKICLNLISMSFTIEDQYEEHLRYCSFRSFFYKRKRLGRGFAFTMIGGNRLSDFDYTQPGSRQKWLKRHGKTIIDFGAGHLHETEMLRQMGCTVHPFEPYRAVYKPGESGGGVCKNTSVKCAEDFLEGVSLGLEYTSIFISSVLNSVPFKKDREHIIQICSALSSPRTTLYVAAMHVGHASFRTVNKQYMSDKAASQPNFVVDYEPGIVLGGFSSKTKVQKYHTSEELYDLIKTGYEKVQVKIFDSTCCAQAKVSCWDKDRLRDALEFEFELPYADGSTMGLSEKAKQVFEKRLNISFDS
jgi:hypothetical protein